MTDILDLIDGAIEDWSTSVDAMRWSPEPTEKPRSPVMDWLVRAVQELEPPGEVPSMFVRLHSGPVALLTSEGSDDSFHYATMSTTSIPQLLATAWDEALVSSVLYGNVYLPVPPRSRPPRVSRMHRSYSARLRARRSRRRD